MTGAEDERAGRRNRHPRRSNRMEAVAAALPRALAPVLARRSPAEAEIVLAWPSLAGDLAAHARPLRLRFPARRGAAGGRDGVLILAVSSGFAPEVQHRAPELVERINALFGYRCVARVSIRQVS